MRALCNNKYEDGLLDVPFATSTILGGVCLPARPLFHVFINCRSCWSYRLVTCPPPSFSDRRPVLPAGYFPVRSPYAGWKSKLFLPFRFGSFVLRWCKCLR